MIVAYGVNKIAKQFAEHTKVTFVTTQPEQLDNGQYTLCLSEMLAAGIELVEKLIVFSTAYDEIVNCLVSQGFPEERIYIYDFYTQKTIHLPTSLIEKKVQPSEILTCFYDLKYCHATFDFLYFILNSEIERIHRNKKSINIIIVPKFNMKSSKLNIDIGVPNSDLELRVNGIIAQLIPCIKNVYSFYLPKCRSEVLHIANRGEYDSFPSQYLETMTMKQYSMSDIKRDIFFDKLKFWEMIEPPEFAVTSVKQYLSRAKGKQVICITLRDYPHESHRASNYQEWEAFINSLDKDKYFPVVVKDTYSIYSSEIKAENIFEPASFDLKLRIALYAQADLNLSVNCGPSALFYFIKGCKSIEFRFIDEHSLSTSKEHMEKISAMHFEEQPFYGNSGRNMVFWGHDNYKNISHAFSNYICDMA